MSDTFYVSYTAQLSPGSLYKHAATLRLQYIPWEMLIEQLGLLHGEYVQTITVKHV